jgi:site-specific DNA-methyltransferase (adenine-specific)
MSSERLSRLPRNVVLAGDAQTRLAGLPSASVDCVVTSPPYFQLRDYGGEPHQLGLEPTVEEYVMGLRAVCREIAHVLKPAGSLWLNLRDVYSRSGTSGIRPKSLLLGPERLLLALAEDGWLVRNRLVWWKRNSMPESIRDRLSMTHEDVFLLTRGRDYFFDLDAIRVPHTSRARRGPGKPNADSPYAKGHRGILLMQAEGRVGHPNGKNPGSVWHYPTSSFRGAHFATFPEALIERPILATCPERLCGDCGQPWAAGYERQGETIRRTSYRASCRCGAPCVPGVVLDPFLGSGTVGVVAQRLRRDWLGIELSRTYRQLARQRLRGLGRPKPHQTTEQCGTLNNTSVGAAAQKEEPYGH